MKPPAMTNETDHGTTDHGRIDRRRFLKLGGAAAGTAAVAGALGSTQLAFADPGQPTNGDLIVLVYLMGGADGLTLFPPHGEGRYYDRRPTLAVPPPGSPGGAIDLDGFFGMHPILQPLFDGPWSDGNLAIVQASGISDRHPSLRSHFAAQEFSQRGSNDPTVQTGWLARYLSSNGVETRVPAASISGGPLDLTLAGYDRAYGIGSLQRFVLDGFGGSAADDAAVRRAFTSAYGATRGLLGAVGSATLDAVFEVENSGAARIQPRVGVDYPQSQLGLGLADVSRFARANVGLQVATVSTGAWDTHDVQANSINGLMNNLAGSISAFYDDLGAMADEVTLIVESEFGRTTEENGSGGTDHGAGGMMMVMGNNVVGGMYHDWPTLTDADGDPDLRVTTDHRAVISEVLTARGNPAPLAEIFPGFRQPAPLGLVT